MNKIKILGAGTAGLITALVLKQAYPKWQISVIESDSIGIIGVGEGSTEHWKVFTEYCDINTNTLIRETDAALKKGIKFENWNGDGKSYFHSLSEPFYSQYNSDILNRNKFVKSLILDNIKTEDVLLETNLIPYHSGVISTNQYHFNTVKLNEFLHKVCSGRGIEFIHTTISDVKLKENGDVESLIGEDGTVYNADFFVDSSGFKRLITSKLGVKWVSYKKYLPMNHALAFPTSDVSDLKPYTLSRALSSGWNWRISTQGRYGNGYVFCDDFIDSTKAHAEVQSVYSEEVKVAKDIKFEAGRVDQFWVNNCVAIGLSASFVEPLEASSIGNSIQQAFGLVQLLDHWQVDRKASLMYNKNFTECFDNIVDFVQMHYFTKRKDSAFWKALPEMMTLTDFNKESIPVFQKTMPSQSMFPNNAYIMFNSSNFAQCMAGLEMYDVDSLRSMFNNRFSEESMTKSFEEYNTYLKELQKSSYIDHKVALEQNRLVVNFDIK